MKQRTQSTIFDQIVMFCSVLVSFVTVRETMPGLYLMHRFVPLTKRCTVSVQKRNERTQSTFLDPIVMFCSVLVSFVTVRETMPFNAPMRPVNEMLHSFGPETKRTHPIHLFEPNSDVFVRFGQFCCCARNHAGVAFNAPVRPLTKRCTVSVQKRNEHTQSTILDPIVMFCYVLVSFVTVRETMPGLHLMHRFAR